MFVTNFIWYFYLECADCLGEGATITSRFSMPLTQLGPKKYYLGIFFKVSLGY